jgi:hypothetical protein
MKSNFRPASHYAIRASAMCVCVWLRAYCEAFLLGDTRMKYIHARKYISSSGVTVAVAFWCRNTSRIKILRPKSFSRQRSCRIMCRDKALGGSKFFIATEILRTYVSLDSLFVHLPMTFETKIGAPPLTIIRTSDSHITSLKSSCKQ